MRSPEACTILSSNACKALVAGQTHALLPCLLTPAVCTPPVLAQWAEVFVDGKLAQHKVLCGPHSTQSFVGFAERMGHSGGEKAFCFSMPRPVFEVAGQSSIQPEQDPDKLADIGSVRVDIHKTNRLRKEVETDGSSGRFRGAGEFEPTDKKTAKSLGSTAAVRAGPRLPGGREATGWDEGGVVKGMAKFSAKKQTVTYYDPPTASNKVASGRIRYATRAKLDVLGLLDLDLAPGPGSVAAPPPAPASDKYSAAHMEACLKHLFGAELKITPELRNALRECEGTYMPIQPALKRPSLPLPAAFSEWSVGKALLDNQALSATAGGGKDELKRKTSLVARLINGDQQTSLTRAVAHQIFGSEQLHTVVEKMLAHAPGAGQSRDAADLSGLAQALSANILVWPSTDSNEPILVKPTVSKFGAQCYGLGLAGGAFTPSRGRSCMHQVRGCPEWLRTDAGKSALLASAGNV